MLFMIKFNLIIFSSHVSTLLRYQFGSVTSRSLWPRKLQHARPPCPSSTPGVYPNPCTLSWWCHPTISSFVVPFSSRLQSFPASGSFFFSGHQDQRSPAALLAKIMFPKSLDVDSACRANELPYVCHSRQKPFFIRVFSNESVRRIKWP